MATPGQFQGQCIIQRLVNAEPLLTAELRCFSRPGNGTRPKNGNQHQTNGCHPSKHFSALKGRRKVSSREGIDERQAQHQDPGDQTKTSGARHGLQHAAVRTTHSCSNEEAQTSPR